MRIAICTTFPNYYWDICAAEMLAGIRAYWPEDIKVYVQLDKQTTKEEFDALDRKIVTILGPDRSFIAADWEDDQVAFVERWKDHKPKSYMDDVVRFSHKVFALEKCADAIKDEVDYLIWLDADVITKKAVTYDWLKDVLPTSGQVVSYLGRENVGYSECGWVAYNLKAGGYELLKSMRDVYINDTFKNWKNGWTDCHVLDRSMKGDVKNLSFDVDDSKDMDVWPRTKLAEKMVHRKGARKLQAAENKVNQTKPEPRVTDIGNMQIKTRNCIDHEKICANVKENISQIRLWATVCKPTGREVVICAAGPSLPFYIEQIRQKKAEGAIIVAVKHALETLALHKIKPDYCVLLDPRGHVEKFIRTPDNDVVYLVASMVDPSVVRTLNDNKCTVLGYHAFVNAGENAYLIHTDLPVSGGSATSTRSIGIFADLFGEKTFHLYGYDLCHYAKPDFTEKNEDGQSKYLEETMGVYTYGQKYVTRTFWTEGQFLAQAQELRNLYKDRKDIILNIHGDGIPAWMVKHQALFEKYLNEYNASLEDLRLNAPTLEQITNASIRRNQPR